MWRDQHALTCLIAIFSSTYEGANELENGHVIFFGLKRVLENNQDDDHDGDDDDYDDEI